MKQPYFPPSELILNPDGSIYHLGILPEHVADTVIVVGDPDRVEQVSQHFDKIHHRHAKREFVTHFGELSGKPLTVISSGIGTDNVEILMHELDALANIDLAQRTILPQHRSLQLIRVGTSGSMQADLACDSLLASTAAVGLDNLMNFYQAKPPAETRQLMHMLQQYLGLVTPPYLAHASAELLAKFQNLMATGITVTCPGFYAPQGRKLRYDLRHPDLLGQLAGYNTPFGRFTNFEMETSAYYALASLLGHQMLSLNAIVANRVHNQFSARPDLVVERLIALTLEQVSR